ncbi:MAG: uncharacterized protein KVP18_004435, partial [Porospora cf. gigantea A]|uniref:uncharacterized protein n=2 Tax=Porospora cf. gigantea A TaxID=2853593 RepID=UPI00355A2981
MRLALFIGLVACPCLTLGLKGAVEAPVAGQGEANDDSFNSATAEPETTTAEPETTTAEPETSTADAETTVEPETSTAEAVTTTIEPQTTTLEPAAPKDAAGLRAPPTAKLAPSTNSTAKKTVGLRNHFTDRFESVVDDAKTFTSISLSTEDRDHCGMFYGLMLPKIAELVKQVSGTPDDLKALGVLFHSLAPYYVTILSLPVLEINALSDNKDERKVYLERTFLDTLGVVREEMDFMEDVVAMRKAFFNLNPPTMLQGAVHTFCNATGPGYTLLQFLRYHQKDQDLTRLFELFKSFLDSDVADEMLSQAMHAEALRSDALSGFIQELDGHLRTL